MRNFRETPYYKAAKETVAIWSISSLIPILSIWLVGGVNGYDGYKSLSGLGKSWSEFFIPTEVFLYVTAIIAPSITYMVFHWRARRHSSAFFALEWTIWGLLLSTAIVYAVSKTNPDVDKEYVFYFAIAAYIVAILTWYITQVFQYRMDRMLEQPRAESGSSIDLSDEGGQ